LTLWLRYSCPSTYSIYECYSWNQAVWWHFSLIVSGTKKRTRHVLLGHWVGTSGFSHTVHRWLSKLPLKSTIRLNVVLKHAKFDYRFLLGSDFISW
jgi:hypothetical protein